MNIIANCKDFKCVKEALKYAWYKTWEDIDMKRAWKIQELFKQIDFIMKEKNQTKEEEYKSLKEETFTEKHESNNGKSISYEEFSEIRESYLLHYLKEPKAREREKMLEEVLRRRCTAAIRIYKSGERRNPNYTEAQEYETCLFDKEMMADTQSDEPTADEEAKEEATVPEPRPKRRKLGVTCDGRIYTLEDFFKKMGSSKEFRVSISNEKHDDD